ncbi:MAG TPA: hypothetical protein DET40_19570 [Lentisphaeria bacterium]|nr:MAG: hypothetical protein A2X45_18400 [Lentisphaerae bacterium GWF2_50_93]HCE45748.1 hypothetical protein [Lentisphaeria bacterium]
MTAYTSGNMEEAVRISDKMAEKRADTGDELMWRLEQGKIKFDSGDYKGSLVAFERCEAIIKEFDDRATINARKAGAETGSAFTNQNALPYSGFNYDRILLNTYKALDYFALGNASDANVELRRAYERQKEAEKRFEDEIKKQEEENKKEGEKAGKQVTFDGLEKEHPELKKSFDEMKSKSNKTYGNLMNPFVTYMSGIRYLINKNMAEADVDFRNLYKMDTENPLSQQYYVTTSQYMANKIPNELSGVKPFNYPLDTNIVFVIFENGLAPAFKERKFSIVVSGIAYSELEYFPTSTESLQITDSSGNSFKTVTISAMDSVVSQEYKEIFPGMITRLVISTLVKEAATAAAVAGASQVHGAGGIAAVVGTVIVTSAYKYTFNTADTRCWQTLPREYQVTQLPLPSDGKLKLKAISRDGAMVSAEPVDITIEKKRAIVHVRHAGQGSMTVRVFEFE